MTHSRLRFGLTVVLGMLLGAAVTVGGLAQAGRLSKAPPQAVVALAQTLEVEHRRVDLLLKRGEVEAALRALEQLREQPWFAESLGDDAIVVQMRHDAYGRLLRLRLDERDETRTLAGLLEVVDEGLGDDEIEANPFTARLYAIKGEILQEMGRDDEALQAYETALAINRVLLERELSTP